MTKKQTANGEMLTAKNLNKMAKKEETKQLLAKKAEELFASNKELTEVHLCVNGQGFTDKAYAERYAKQFDDDNVYTFSKESEALECSGKVVAIDVEFVGAGNETAPDNKGESGQEDAPNDKGNVVDAEIDTTQDAPFDYENVHKELLNDRAFLVARYEALEGKKPAHNIGTEKLTEKVQEIEKERFKK